MSIDNNPNPDEPGEPIDLAEVRRLVDALEYDLERAQAGDTDIQTLRAEVEALRRALHADAPPEGVGHHLERVHSNLEDTLDTLQIDAFKSADYLTRIGRLLGL